MDRRNSLRRSVADRSIPLNNPAPLYNHITVFSLCSFIGNWLELFLLLSLLPFYFRVVCKPSLATGRNCSFCEQKEPKKLSASIRYALGSAVLRVVGGDVWRGRAEVLMTLRASPNAPPKHRADTAKASQRDALGSLLGTFSSEPSGVPRAEQACTLCRGSARKPKVKGTVPADHQRTTNDLLKETKL